MAPSSPLNFAFPQNTSVPHTPLVQPLRPVVIEPLLIDTLAHDFKVEATYRANMHAFVDIALSDGQLGKSDIITRLYLLAASYADISERRRIAADQSSFDLKGLYRDIMTQLSGAYTLTTEQKYNVRKITSDFIYQWNRTSFVLMHTDILKHLRENREALGLANIFENLAREKVLVKVLKTTCSSVRNALRQDIRDSITSDNCCSLAQFTFQSANKYRRGQFDDGMGFGFTVHNALLRRFGLDNLNILKMDPEQGEMPTDDGDKDDESLYEQTTPGSAKRSRRQHGRLRKGEDFWSKVDAWFADQMKLMGRDLAGPLWKEFINDVINRDNFMFDSDADANITEVIVAQGGGIASMMGSG